MKIEIIEDRIQETIPFNNQSFNDLPNMFDQVIETINHLKLDKIENKIKYTEVAALFNTLFEIRYVGFPRKPETLRDIYKDLNINLDSINLALASIERSVVQIDQIIVNEKDDTLLVVRMNASILNIQITMK
jgi:hypothetical protein